MSNQLKNRGQQLKLVLKTDPKRGMAKLIAFTKEFAADNKQIEDSLLLSINFTVLNEAIKWEELLEKLEETPNEADQRNILRQEVYLTEDKLSKFLNLLKQKPGSQDLKDQLRSAHREKVNEKLQDIILEATTIVDQIVEQPGKGETQIDKSVKAVSLDKKVVFKATNLGKKYARSNFYLGGINITLRLGEITGIVGQNATGKTTILRMIAGDLKQNEGTLEYPEFQKDATFNWREIKKKIAYLPQELPPWKGKILDHLHFEAAIHSNKDKTNSKEVNFIVHRFGLVEHQHKKWTELSGGYKLRFSLAKALIRKPELLILDEPLAFLDVTTQKVLLRDLRMLASGWRSPISIILTSQHLHEVEHLADHMMVLNNQEVVFNEPLEDLGRLYDDQIFELKCSTTIEKLWDLLEDLPIVDIRDEEINFAIITKKELKQNDLLNALIRKGVDISYFRSVGQSTKRFFI